MASRWAYQTEEGAFSRNRKNGWKRAIAAHVSRKRFFNSALKPHNKIEFKQGKLEVTYIRGGACKRMYVLVYR